VRERAAAVFPIAVSVVALAAVVWWATRQEAPELPRTGDAAVALAIAIALYALATAARAERWHRIVQRAGVAATRSDSYRLTAVGYMGNNVLPARSGDVLRAFLLAPIAHTRKRNVLGTVVAERLLDAAALGLVFLVVALGLAGDVDVPGGATALLLALAGGAAVGFALLWALASDRLRAIVRPLASPTRRLASTHGAGLLALSLALWTLEATVYLAVGRAVEIDLGLVEALYIVALTNLFALVPAAPGYVGTFDAAVLFAVDSLGASGSDALSYLVLLRFVLFVPITIVGLAFLITRYGGWSRYRAARLAQ
jgi:glycosyltransferase 2 family protein